VPPPQRSAGFHLSQFDIPIWGPQTPAWSKCSNQGRIPEDKTHLPTSNDWCFAGRRAIHSRWIRDWMAAVNGWISCSTWDEPQVICVAIWPCSELFRPPLTFHLSLVLFPYLRWCLLACLRTSSSFNTCLLHLSTKSSFNSWRPCSEVYKCVILQEQLYLHYKTIKLSPIWQNPHDQQFGKVYIAMDNESSLFKRNLYYINLHHIGQQDSWNSI
jgi:hypothetical protein